MHKVREQDLGELDFAIGKGTPVYRDYVEALLRLLNDEPTDVDLLGLRDLRRDKEGEDARIPVNLKNVMAEAQKVDRKALLGENPRFKKLATYIKSIKTTLGVTTTTQRLVDTLQEEKRDLRQMVRVLRSKLALEETKTSDIRRDLVLAEKEAKRWREKAGRP